MSKFKGCVDDAKVIYGEIVAEFCAYFYGIEPKLKKG